MSSLVTMPFQPSRRPAWYAPLGYVVAVLGVAAATAVLWVAQPLLSLGSVYLVYLVVVVAVAVGWGLGQGVAASVLAFLCANFFFIDPIFTFTIAEVQDVLALIIFLALATLTSQLVAGLRREAQEAQRNQQITAALYSLTQAINRQHDLKPLLQEVTRQLRDVLALDACSVELTGVEGVGAVTAVSGTPTDVEAAGPKPIRYGLSLDSRSVGSLTIWPSAGKEHLSREEERIVEAFRDQLQVAIERARLQQIAIQTEVLRRTDALRVALLSAVAHDLRTPLTSIKTAAGSLLSTQVAWTEDEERDFLRAITGEVDRINRMVGNLLDMSRIEEGRLRPQKELHLIGDVIDTVLDRLRPGFEEHPLKVKVEPGLPPVLMDEVEIDEVLTNLLENAIKYTPAGTPISISAQRTEDDIQVEVADQGPGVPPSALPYLFDRFYRVKAGPGGVKGTGLGLAIVKGIVEAHGGRVSAENRPEGGMSFSFTLPVQPRIRNSEVRIQNSAPVTSNQ
jgi:two-component system sensor histidine kinase KdpD